MSFHPVIRSLAALALGAALGAVIALPVQAQITVRGTVRAQRGQPLAGASIAVPPDAATVHTDRAGQFRVTFPVGRSLVLLITADGFASSRIELGSPLDAEHLLAIVMRPLAKLDARTIVASLSRPLLNTENAATGGSVEAREIAALPTDARDPISLLYNIPGVTPATGFFGDAPRLSFNGGNSLYTQYLLDGLDNNEGFLGGPRVEVPLGAIARMDALVNSYSTRVGRSSDGVVDVSSAAGSDRTSGDFFAYSRPGLPYDARAPRLTLGPAPEAVARSQAGFRRTQLGGSLRGALAPGKTYFASAVEYTRENEDRIGSTALAQFLGTETRQTVKLLGRIDHGWSPTQTTTLRVAASLVDRAGNGSGVVTPEADITTRREGTLSALTHRSALFNLRASNIASVQYGTFHWYFPPARSDFSRPQVTVITPSQVTEAVVGSSNFVFDEMERQWQVRDVFEIALGDKHTVRAGADVIASRFELTAASTNPHGSYVVYDDGNIVKSSGRPLSFTDIHANVRVASYTIDARPQQVNLSQNLYSAFLEDTWRPGPALTVTGGLRWDYDDLTSRGDSRPDLDNWQPRLSFNWLSSTTTVVRGGIGRYTGRFPYAMYSDAVQLGESGNAVLTYSGSSAPAFRAGKEPAAVSSNEIKAVPHEVFRTFARGLEQPTSSQATLGYERQLGSTWSVSTDIVWSDTKNLPWMADLNPIARRLTAADSLPLSCASAPSCPGDSFRVQNPTLAGYRRISTAQTGGTARYVALYTSLRHAMNDSWQLDANWVWSHAQNNTEDINFSATQGNCFSSSHIDAVTGQRCTSDEWADANNDRRHRVTLRSVFDAGSGLTWGIIGNAETGVPVNRLAGSANATGTARYDLLGSGPIRGNSFIGNGDRFFGVARNAERLPGSFTVATNLAYHVPLRGAGMLEIRADVFNLFNTLVWGGYANGIGGGGDRTQFGRPGDRVALYASAPGRQFQFSARYAFGDPGTR